MLPAIQRQEVLMDTEMRHAISATDKEAQYDASAKRLLGQKSILAYILVKTVEEFKGMKPKDVIPLIEGEPYISSIPIEPGLTNRVYERNGQRIVGLNTESREVQEGLIWFDIIFYVRMKDGLSQIIVNVEPQKDEPSEYWILNRAIFYGCRMISSQKERDFINSNYNDIKQVYTIWVCMNMKSNSMCHIHFTKDDMIDNYDWKGNLDLVNIVMIGLGKELPEHDEKYELHRLLGALLSKELTKEEKYSIIESEYKIPIKEELGEELRSMSNLGLGVREYGIEIGKEIGQIQGAINSCKVLELNRAKTKEVIMKQFLCSEEKAEEYLQLYW